MKLDNIAGKGSSYGNQQTQKYTIPNEDMMQMDLGAGSTGGSNAKAVKVITLSRNPHLGKLVDFNYGREDPVKFYVYAAENKRKSDYDEGVSIPESMLSPTEPKKDMNQLNERPLDTTQKKDDEYKNSYSGSYSGSYKKDKKLIVYGIKSKKEESNSDYKIISMVKALEKKAKTYLSKFYDPNKESNDEPKQEKPYEGKGIAGKVAYFAQKIKSYVQKFGYDPKSNQENSNYVIDDSNTSNYGSSSDYTNINFQNYFSFPKHLVQSYLPDSPVSGQELEQMVDPRVIPIKSVQESESLEEKVILLIN